MMKNRITLVISIVMIVTAPLGSTAAGSAPPAKPVECGQVEVLGGVAFTHCFAQAANLAWHYVEAGQGEPIVFLHGLPESWFSWHHQLEDLAADYHVIAVDLKGYGQSDKSEGNYHPENDAEEILALLDLLDLDRFNLVTHDWGSFVADYLAVNHPERILRYLRMQAWLDKFDPESEPQFRLFRNPALARFLMSNPRSFARNVYQSVTVQTIPEEELQRLIQEFSRPGVSGAVPRYFRDTPLESFEEIPRLAAAMNFPLLLLQAVADPAQPRSYFDGATELFPDAELQWVEDSGHFTELEQPQAVIQAIRGFLLKPVQESH